MALKALAQAKDLIKQETTLQNWLSSFEMKIEN